MNNIIFKKPKIKDLLKNGFMVSDLHTHSNCSDGLNSVFSMAKKAKKLGTALCIADHNSIKCVLELEKIKNIMTIPAIELNTLDGPHLLLYFYNFKELDEYYSKFVKDVVRKNPNSRIDKGLMELLENSKDYNCITSLPHPFGPLWLNVAKAIEKNKFDESIFRKVDCIEAINGEQLRVVNSRAAELADRYDRGITGGSDGHSVFEIGGVVTYAEASTREEFLNALKNRRSSVVGKETNIPKRFVGHTNVIRKHAPYFGRMLLGRARTKIKFSKDELLKYP